jgi:hypothetical protein
MVSEYKKRSQNWAYFHFLDIDHEIDILLTRLLNIGLTRLN